MDETTHARAEVARRRKIAVGTRDHEVFEHYCMSSFVYTENSGKRPDSYEQAFSCRLRSERAFTMKTPVI